METRFFAPGALVANLDFVERIFGNAGDPHLPENDAALDPQTGPATPAASSSPRISGASPKRNSACPPSTTPRRASIRDGMCWQKPEELYNDGSPSNSPPATPRAHRHLHFRQLFRLLQKRGEDPDQLRRQPARPREEEHAGGAIVFPSYDLGEDFQLSKHLVPSSTTPLPRRSALLGDRAVLQPGGWARDRHYPDICYVPDGAYFDLRKQRITWPTPAETSLAEARNAVAPEHSIKLLPGQTYVLPSGYKVDMVKPDEGRRWRLRGTTAEGVLCHKPCTVSGGGKSEISKSIADADHHRPGLRQRFRRDSEPRRFDPLPRIRPPLPRPRAQQDPRPPPPQRRALPRLRRQTPQLESRLHRRIQRLARHHPALHPRHRPHHQARLQARVGRRTGAVISASTRSTAAPATS
jgi:hypothetical protein